jgi:hypothetical protein
MTERIHRNLGRVECLELGEWTSETASGRPAIRCPECGTIVDLEDRYRIDVAGHVSPTWRCGTMTCALVAWITLVDYAEEVLR